MENIKLSSENKEFEPQHNIVKFLGVRHGETEYLESITTEEDKLKMNGVYPRDLTTEGEVNFRKTAVKIAGMLDSEKDIVVLWSSPKWRAQGSEQILVEELKKRDIEIYKDSSIKSMRASDEYNQEAMVKVWSSLKAQGLSTDMHFAHDPGFQEENDNFEVQSKVKRRSERFFNYIRYLTEHIDLRGKRLCILGVSHFEFLNPIMEDIYGEKSSPEELLKKNEIITISFDFNKQTKEMKISADFRGEHKEGISFDKENRHFIVND